MTWKVTPKTFTDEVGQSKTIVGIECKLVNPIIFDLNEFKEHSLCLAFRTSTGGIHGERNVYTKDFELKMVGSGATEQVAKAQVKGLIKNICFGTPAEMYASATVLAGMYGYALLPIEEQVEAVV
jgi:hypothetical protein